MTATQIPNFEIVGPIRNGLLDQFWMMAWKWHGLGGMYGQAAQVSTDDPPIVDHVVRKFVGIGRRLHRRMIVSPNRHLWALVWRTMGRASRAERDLAWLSARTRTIGLPLPRRSKLQITLGARLIRREWWEE